MNADGSGQRRLTNGGVPGCGQECSSLVARRAEDRHRERSWGARAAIYVMNVDGSGERRLSSYGSCSFLVAGRAKIAFIVRSAPPAEILVMNADGSGERGLTRNAVASTVAPAWSPDGRKIAFVERRRDGNRRRSTS